MSRNSKAKRDQRKKRQPKRPFQRLDRTPQVANHAVMVDDEQGVVAAIGQQDDGQWLLSIGGQTMGNAANPVSLLAMLQHLAALQQKEGKNVRVEYSEVLQQMIDELAAAEGITSDEYLTRLVAEFAEAEGDEDDADTEAADPQAAADDTDTGQAASEPAADTPAKGS
ncbi:MAG TPA: hypothetical protein VD865_17735 [Stenotrophomonas sp.]|nr:hypothetical protein [Stenotrophomonas sp.]